MKKIILGVTCLLGILLCISMSSAFVRTSCVKALVSDISPSSIGIGEEFTIGIQIENCGSTIPEFVQFELINPPTDIEIKEPLVIEVPRLNYANSERFITYHMRITENASPGNYLIKTRLTYGEKDSLTVENDNISFLVRGEKAELNLASVKVKLPTASYGASKNSTSFN